MPQLTHLSKSKTMFCGINELELEFAFDQAETDVP